MRSSTAVGLVGFDLGEEPDPADLHAQHGDPRDRGHTRRAQERPVAADRQHQIEAIGEGPRGRLVLGVVAGERPGPDPALLEPRPDREGGIGRGRAARVDDEPRRLHPLVPITRSPPRARGPPRARPPRPRRRRRAAPPSRGAGTRCCRRARAAARPSRRSATGRAPRRPRRRRGSRRATRPRRGRRLRDPTRSRPTSNCGLTRSTRSASSDETRASAGTARRSEMNDRSATTIPGAYGRSSARRSRTLVRSSTVTRSSVRSDQASCP